jgi:hypothetical protein
MNEAGTHANGGDICFTSSQFYCWNKDSKEELTFFMAYSPPHPSPNTAMMVASLLLSESFSLYVV